MPELLIDSHQTITGVQKQFNSAFPFLKIEFFSQAPLPGIGNPKNKMIVFDMKLSEFQNINKRGKIDITARTTVSDLEKYFASEFGLYIQVFRKSGKIWLETTATDNWTLNQQNEEGRSLEQHLKTDRENPNDHDMY